MRPRTSSGPPDLEPARLADAIRAGAGVADLDPRIERIGPFHSPGQLADRFRAGRAFLAGDAAHRVTPRGGTGMNTALQSGYDLGWKLAWVLQGWADAELLDTYEAERRVVAEHNLTRSIDPNGSRRPVARRALVDLGGRIAHAWLPSTSGRVSTLDLLGPGWTLFTGPIARRLGRRRCARPRVPLTVSALDAVTARTIGVRGDGALLARPDGVPVAVWASSAGAAELPPHDDTAPRPARHARSRGRLTQANRAPKTLATSGLKMSAALPLEEVSGARARAADRCDP